MALSFYKVAAVNEDWAPLVGIQVEAMNLSTLVQDDVQTTGLDGVVTFTGLPAGPHFFKVRGRRASNAVAADLTAEGRVRSFSGAIHLQVIAIGGQGIAKDAVVDADGMGTHTTLQAAITTILAIADAANGGTYIIHVNGSTYEEQLTIALVDGCELIIEAQGGAGNRFEPSDGRASMTSTVLKPQSIPSASMFTVTGYGGLTLRGLRLDDDSAYDTVACSSLTLFHLELDDCVMSHSTASKKNINIADAFRSLRIANSVLYAQEDNVALVGRGTTIGTVDVANVTVFEHSTLASQSGVNVLFKGGYHFISDCYLTAGGAYCVRTEKYSIYVPRVEITGGWLLAQGAATIAVDLDEATGKVVGANIRAEENDPGTTQGIRLNASHGVVIGGNRFVSLDKGVNFVTAASEGVAVVGNAFTVCDEGIVDAGSKIGVGSVIGPNAFNGSNTADMTGVADEFNYQISVSDLTHDMLDGTVHTDTVAQVVTAGSLIYGDDTPKWNELAISVPAANVRNVLGVDNGETVPSWKTALDGTNPANIANSASPGTSLVFAHRDHIHAHPAGLTATLHHTKYTDNEAVTAVQAANPLALTNALTVGSTLGLASYIEFAEITKPSNPSDGFGRLYMKNDDKIYWLATDGTESDLTGGGYTDADAIAAVEGEPTLALDGAITEIHGDANFTLSIVSSNPRLTMDSGDYLEYDRAGNYFYTDKDFRIDGHAAIGGGAIYALRALSIEPTFTETAAGPPHVYGERIDVIVNPGGHSAAQFNGLMMYAHSADVAYNFTNVSSLIGFQAITQHWGSGLMTSLYGTWMTIGIVGSGNVTDGYGFKIRGNSYPGSSGKFVNLYYFYAQAPLAAGSGSADNFYGMYFEDLSFGTNNYALYFAGTSGLARQGIWWNGDTNLYRSAANTLKTDDSLYVATALAVGATGDVSAGNRLVDVDGTLATATGFGMVFTPLAAAGVTTFYGIYARLGISAGTVTNGYAFYVDNPSGAGAMTNAYGLYINDIAKGANNYAIYLAGTSGLARQGIWWNGDTNLYRSAANTLKTDGDFVVGGDFSFGGEGSGLPYGCMHGHNMAETVAVASADTWYELATGLSSAETNLETFANAHELTVTKAGRYLITWSLSVRTGTAQDEIEGTVAINNTANTNLTAHGTLVKANASINLAGSQILDLAAADDISMAVLNHSAARDIVVEHVTCTVVMVGGA